MAKKWRQLKNINQSIWTDEQCFTTHLLSFHNDTLTSVEASILGLFDVTCAWLTRETVSSGILFLGTYGLIKLEFEIPICIFFLPLLIPNVSSFSMGSNCKNQRRRVRRTIAVSVDGGIGNQKRANKELMTRFVTFLTTNCHYIAKYGVKVWWVAVTFDGYEKTTK